MLRRVARVLRIGLIGLAGAFCLWLPFSYFWLVGLKVPLKIIHSVSVTSVSGVLELDIAERMPPGVSADAAFDVFSVAELEKVLPPSSTTDQMLRPDLFQCDWAIAREVNVVTLAAPLWLLAFICLAWPVTSFIIARRRKGRGFEVEPAGTSNIEHPTSNIEGP